MDKWKQIYNTLSENGIAVYSPGAHEGVCTSPYCVIQQSGGVLQNGSLRHGRVRYRVHMLVPLNRPSAMDTLAMQVRTALAAMESDRSLYLSQPRGATVTDDARYALSSYIEYVSYYTER